MGTEIAGVVGFPETWRERPRKTTSLRPKIVCKPCNNEWMSVLQEQARPYLAGFFRGDEAHLDGAAQAAIAAWLAMTAMTGSWANSDYGGWGIPRTLRRQLQSTSQVPQGMRIWIAPCTHDDRPAGLVARAVRYRLIPLEHVPVVTAAGVKLPFRPAFAVAMSIGNMAALIFGHTYDPIWQPGLSYDGRLGLALKRVFPATQEVLDWPRDFALNYVEFDTLINVLEPWQ
jgi:hypothetical protein